MTAMMTGIKTRQGVAECDRPGSASTTNCASARNKRQVARRPGSGRGDRHGHRHVSTARITHATPAADFAHTANRDWEANAEMSAGQAAPGYRGAAGRGLTPVRLRSCDGRWPLNFLPVAAADPEDEGATRPAHGRCSLTQEWLAAATRRRMSGTRRSSTRSTGTTATCSDCSSPRTWSTSRPPASRRRAVADRDDREGDRHPAKHPKGFLLHVEGGRIDHAHHAGNAIRALTETIALTEAVRTALQATGER